MFLTYPFDRILSFGQIHNENGEENVETMFSTCVVAESFNFANVLYVVDSVLFCLWQEFLDLHFAFPLLASY